MNWKSDLKTLDRCSCTDCNNVATIMSRTVAINVNTAIAANILVVSIVVAIFVVVVVVVVLIVVIAAVVHGCLQTITWLGSTLGPACGHAVLRRLNFTFICTTLVAVTKCDVISANLTTHSRLRPSPPPHFPCVPSPSPPFNVHCYSCKTLTSRPCNSPAVGCGRGGGAVKWD